MERFMGKVSELHRREIPALEFVPSMRGSMSEESKHGMPDEFDYLLKLSRFTECCNKVDFDGTRRARFSCSKEKREAMKMYIDKEGYLNSNNIMKQFISTLKKVICSPEVWNDSSLKFVSFREMKVGAALKVVYNGPVFKLLQISVDLVPVIAIRVDRPPRAP